MDLGEHISEETLEQYALEKLAEADTRALEMHLLVYETCRDRLKDLDEFIAALRTAVRKMAQAAAPKG